MQLLCHILVTVPYVVQALPIGDIGGSPPSSPISSDSASVSEMPDAKANSPASDPAVSNDQPYEPAPTLKQQPATQDKTNIVPKSMSENKPGSPPNSQGSATPKAEPGSTKVTTPPSSQSAKSDVKADYGTQQVRSGSTGYDFDPANKVWTDKNTGAKFQEADNKLTPMEAPTIQDVRSGKSGYEFNAANKVWTDPKTGAQFQESNNQLAPIKTQSIESVRSGDAGYTFDAESKIWTDPKTGNKYQEVNNKLSPISSSSSEGGSQPKSPSKASTDNSSKSSGETPPATKPRSTEQSPSANPATNGPSSADQTAPSQDNAKPATQSGGGEFAVRNSGGQQPKVAKLSADSIDETSSYNQGVSRAIKDPAQVDEAQALFKAASSVETSLGSNRPNPDEQARRGKLGSDSEEIGVTRMNRAMLKDLGYSEADMKEMNSGTDSGDALNAEAFTKGVQKYGRDGFMSYQRGGITRYNEYKKTGQVTADTKLLADDYDNAQKANLQAGSSSAAFFQKSGAPEI